jgi:hypothetical protein
MKSSALDREKLHKNFLAFGCTRQKTVQILSLFLNINYMQHTKHQPDLIIPCFCQFFYPEK